MLHKGYVIVCRDSNYQLQVQLQLIVDKQLTMCCSSQSLELDQTLSADRFLYYALGRNDLRGI